MALLSCIPMYYSFWQIRTVRFDLCTCILMLVMELKIEHYNMSMVKIQKIFSNTGRYSNLVQRKGTRPWWESDTTQIERAGSVQSLTVTVISQFISVIMSRKLLSKLLLGHFSKFQLSFGTSQFSRNTLYGLNRTSERARSLW